MANPGVDETQLRKVLATMKACGDNQSEAARQMGMNRSTFRHQLRSAKDLPPATSPAYSIDPVPDDSEDTSDLILRLAKRAKKRKDKWKALQWRRIRLNTDEPFAITWITDPHMGDPGCDFSTLVEHLDITAKTPSAYAAFMGDATNNWPTNGRLARKWADQETSKQQETQLIEWLMKDSGVDWLFWVLGNHDIWGDGEAIMRLINSNLVPMHDWRAQFILECGNKREIKLDVSHNFKGHSQWNTLHAEGKEAQMGQGADFYFSGHLHTAALHYEEFARRGITAWLMRCKGYKENDEYAHHLQFPEQDGGHAGVTVIDPRSEKSNPIVFATLDVFEGMDYLNWKRRNS